MIQEDKELLLKDLCARLPYGVKVENTSFSELQIHTLFGRVSDDEFLMLETYKSVGGEDYRRVTDDVHYTGYLESIKPYLRPMSSMTQKEIDEYDAELDKDMDIVMDGALDKDRHITSDGKHNFSKNFVTYFGNDWLNAHHFDYRGLIEKGLALEAPEGMYKI